MIAKLKYALLGAAVAFALLAFGKVVFAQQPPTLDQARVEIIVGRLHVQVALQGEYIEQLKAKIAELQAQLDKIKGSAPPVQ